MKPRSLQIYSKKQKKGVLLLTRGLSAVTFLQAWNSDTVGARRKQIKMLTFRFSAVKVDNHGQIGFIANL